MPRRALSERIIAEIIFRERLPGEEGLAEPVQWQMPNKVFRWFEAEARRRGTDLNTLIRDVICSALTERAEAIRRINAAMDSERTD